MAEALREALERRARKLKKLLRRAAAGDPDAVHDARTTIRRLREGLVVMGRTVFDAGRVGVLEDRLHTVEKKLGPTRDDDVLLDGVRQWKKQAPRAARGGIEAVEKQLAGRRKKHARRLSKALQRKSTRRTAKQVRRFMHGRPPATVAPPRNPAHAVPSLVRHFLADEIWRAYEEVLAYDTRVPTADFDIIHKVRSACRRLRYRLELFEGAVPTGTTHVVDELRLLQDRLGELHDHVVAVATLEKWLVEGRLLPAEPIDDYVRAERQIRDGMRGEFDDEWRSLAGAAFRQAIAQVASCEERSRSNGAIRLVPLGRGGS